MNTKDQVLITVRVKFSNIQLKQRFDISAIRSFQKNWSLSVLCAEFCLLFFLPALSNVSGARLCPARPLGRIRRHEESL